MAIVAIDDREQVLMLRHVFHPYTPWGLPGGWLNRNEAPADAGLRELREETGLTAVLGPVVQVLREPRPGHIGIAYLARILPGGVSLSPEIIEARWFPVDELPAPLLPFIRDAIHSGLTMHRALRAASGDEARVDQVVLLGEE